MSTRPKILIVDDNEFNRLVLHTVLRDLPVDLVDVDNGFDAITLSLTQNFALILLDVQMPEIDGFEVCEQLRADPRTAQVPIVFITAAYKETADKMRGYLLGATDYLAKPIDDQLLRAKVEVFLRLYQQQQQLQQQNEALAQSNAELEQFAYVISHDLRQPLRMIHSFSQMLARRLDHTLEDETRQMMFFINDGAERMDQMLVSLLEYSRIGRLGEPKQWCALRDLLEIALHFLSPQIKESQADIKIQGDWPTLEVSKHEIARLFQNLLQNAIKYHEAGKLPAISIHVTQQAEDYLFSITDSGIGIAPEQQGRLFRMFQRLCTREEFEGTGIGLAIARKIVERHQGHIQVFSKGLGQGSTFSFTLPKNK